MSDFENYLMSGKRHAKLSPESLELMGKQAANAFLDEDISLNDSIAKLAGAHDDISAEQIKRIVEFANTAVYLAKHDQNKTAGSEHSYPQFELADAGRIIQDLSDGARPTVVTKTDIDYSRQAKKEKVSSSRTEKALEELFKVASAEKDYSEETVINEVMAAKETLLALKQNIGDRYNQHESLFKEAAAEFYDIVKRHVLEGGSFGEVYTALQSVAGDDLSDNLQPIVKGLISEKVAKAEDLKKQFADKEKSAHRTVNPEHPLLKTYAAMVMAGEELQKTAGVLDEVHQELGALTDFIKEAFTKEKAAGLLSSLPGMIGKLGRGAIGEMRRNPIQTLGTAKSLMPQRQPAPVPPGAGGF